MLKLTSIDVNNFFLPEDGEEARGIFLNQLQSAEEAWILAYGFNMPEIFNIIKQLDTNGVKVHMLLDNVQAHGPSELPLLINLHKTLKNGDMTITTAGIGSSTLGAIWHWKVLVTRVGDTYTIFDGSINFSPTGWKQGNSGRQFVSTEWATKLIDEFTRHKAWALENRPQYQIDESRISSAHMNDVDLIQFWAEKLTTVGIIPEALQIIMGACTRLLEKEDDQKNVSADG